MNSATMFHTYKTKERTPCIECYKKHWFWLTKEISGWIWMILSLQLEGRQSQNKRESGTIYETCISVGENRAEARLAGTWITLHVHESKVGKDETDGWMAWRAVCITGRSPEKMIHFYITHITNWNSWKWCLLGFTK